VLPVERIQPGSVYGSANGFGSRRIIAENRTRAAAEMDKAFLFYFAIFLKSGSDFHLGNRGLSPIIPIIVDTGLRRRDDFFSASLML
jgi:hypothetical protein